MIKWWPILLLIFCTCIGTAAERLLVDPTRPHTSKNLAVTQDKGLKPAAGTPLQVMAIFISQQNKHAIINGKNYSEGQMVLGNKIISIEKHRVVLRGANGSKELFINYNHIKKDVSHGF
jgi:MSHA biogenesis protein MshK